MGEGGEVDEPGGESARAGGGDPAGTDTDSSATIRRYQPGDEAALRRLYRRSMRDAGTDPDDVPGIDDLERIEEAYLDAGGEFLVAEVDGEVAAMGGLAAEREGLEVDLDEGDGELLRIAVDPDVQRLGLGTAIVERLEAAARERGLDRIVLVTTRRQSAATSFYADRGYAETDRELVDGYELIHFEKEL